MNPQHLIYLFEIIPCLPWLPVHHIPPSAPNFSLPRAVFFPLFAKNAMTVGSEWFCVVYNFALVKIVSFGFSLWLNTWRGLKLGPGRMASVWGRRDFRVEHKVDDCENKFATYYCYRMKFIRPHRTIQDANKWSVPFESREGDICGMLNNNEVINRRAIIYS